MDSDNGSQVTMFFHFPFRLRAEGKGFVATCEPLRVHERGATEDAALHTLANALDTYIQVSLSQGALPALIQKLTAALPPRPFVSFASLDAASYRIDREQGEILVPVIADSPKARR